MEQEQANGVVVGLMAACGLFNISVERITGGTPLHKVYAKLTLSRVRSELLHQLQRDFGGVSVQPRKPGTVTWYLRDRKGLHRLLTQLEPHKEQLPLRLRLEIELARQFLGTSLRGLVRGLPSYEAVVQKREQLHTQMQQLHAGDAPANELANGLEVLDE